MRESVDWELSFLACNESFSFFFFFRNPRVGIYEMAGLLRVERDAPVDGAVLSLCAFRMDECR
jgi:hypothetical protein